MQNRMRIGFVLLMVGFSVLAETDNSGKWPEPRQNAHLTAYQSLQGALKDAPRELACIALTQTTANPVYFTREGAPAALCLIGGALECHQETGGLRWKCHPAGLNFERIQQIADFDQDGRTEILAVAGRAAQPFGAVALINATDGALLWRYDVEPMSYSWDLFAGHYLPNRPTSQILVIMQGYPPDKQNGYMALFDFAEKGSVPHLVWRYDFSEYTCFPKLLQSDVDGDGVKELAVVTHSRMWVMDSLNGTVKQFIKWDVTPANVRSYGLNRFLDLNGDGREDFLCIANFSQHHEVLLNREGKLEEAWHYGWHESVTTGTVATTWPEPPVADLDGDKALEVVVSMFNSENKPEWLVRAYDAVSGKQKYTYPGIVANALIDANGDGIAEILGNATTDATRAVLQGARVLKVRDNAIQEIWKDELVTVPEPKEGTKDALVIKTGVRFLIAKEGDTLTLHPAPIDPPPPPNPSIPLPKILWEPGLTLLAAKTCEGGSLELLIHSQDQVKGFRMQNDTLTSTRTYPSECPPVCADLNGDGLDDVVVCLLSATAPPRIEAYSGGDPAKRLWSKQLDPAERTGLPAPRKAYLRAVHFTGRTTPDIYVWLGTPLVRSLALHGVTGDLLWEKAKSPISERYWGPSTNFASAYDVNGDTKEDLVFANPDYYCVADAVTGDPLKGPLFPPDIFKQPSQGLYTYPAILSRTDNKPLVALVDGHYFQGVMTLDAEPLWYKLPVVGENRCAMEAFLPLDPNTWLLGYGRQNGMFACLNVFDGTVRWEYPAEAACSDAIAGDVDGDKRPEFVFGTSHGALVAVCDDNGKPHLVWKLETNAALSAPILADLNGDGYSEIACISADGYLRVFGVPKTK